MNEASASESASRKTEGQAGFSRWILVLACVGLGAARIGYQYPLDQDPMFLAHGIFHFSYGAFLAFETSMRLPNWSDKWATIGGALALLAFISGVALVMGGWDALWWSLAAVFSWILAGILLRTGYVGLRKDTP